MWRACGAILLGLALMVGCLHSARGADLVDLNRASMSELMELPGIGRKRAEAITEFRQTRQFRRIADLLRIKGVGRQLFMKIRTLVKVEPTEAEPVQAAAHP